MKNRSFLKTIILLFLGGLLALTALSSCDNFLKNGQDLRQEIEDVIAYNNAASCSIIFRMDNTDGKPAVGEFIGSTERTIRKGYNLEVEFRINTDSYYFKTLEAVSQSDRKISRNDCVKFEELERNDKEGKYKYKITLLQDVKDILIQPKCYAVPAVESHSPANAKQTLTTDKPIKIYFNTPVNQDIKENVKIEILGTDVSDCFELPELNQDGTELTLTPKFDSLADFITNTLKVLTADVNISFDKSTTVRIGDKDLPLKQDDNSVFSVRYLGTKETTPPKKEDFFVTRNKIDLTSAKTETQKFSQAAIDLSPSTTDEKIVQNSSNGTIYIYGAYSGEDYGIDKVSIVEKRTNDQSAWSVSDVETVTAEYTLENAEFITDDAGNVYFCIKHELQAQKPDFEGAVAVKVLVYDICGNADEQSFTAIIKRKMSLDDIIVYNFTRDNNIRFNSLGNTKTIDLEAYRNNVKNIKFLNDELQLKLYGNVCIPRDYFHLFCRFGDNIEQEFGNPDSDGIWKLDLNTESVDNLPFKICYTDSFGLKTERDFRYPSSYITIYSFEEHNYSDGTYYEVVPQNPFYDVRVIKQVSGEASIWERGSAAGFFYPKESEEPSNYYFITFQKYHFDNPDEPWDPSQLCSELVSFESVLGEYTDPAAQEQIQVSHREEFDGTDTLNIYVTFLDEDIWTKYDTITYCLPDDFYGFIKSGELTFCIPVKLSQTKNISSSMDIGAYSNSSLKGRAEIPWYDLNIWDLAKQYDNIKPYIVLLTDEIGGYSFYFTDDLSGVAGGKMIVGDQERTFTGSYDDTEVFISYSDIIKYAKESDKSGIVRELSLPYDFADTAGNRAKSTYELLIPKQEHPYTISFTKNAALTYVDVNLDSNNFTNTEDVGLMLFKYSEHDASHDTAFWTHIDYACFHYGREGTSPARFQDITANTFYKIGVEDENCAVCDYYYLGTQNTGKYDGLMANGNSNSSVLITSDAPVLVHTMVTSRPYSECSTWTLYDWEQYRKELGLTVLQFTPDEEHTITDSQGNTYKVNTGDHSPKRYDIPLKDIGDGQCYCVIAYFADGTSVMSQVMQK